MEKMKKIVFCLGVILILLTACSTQIKTTAQAGISHPVEEKSLNIGGENMKLTSKEFENNENIPKKFTCQGQDINPELEIKDIPENTKSLALSVKDPDAPMGTFVHWLVYNISPNTKKIEENSVPGTQVMNDFGKEDYGGPCPPSGVHRYFFRVYALDTSELEPINTKQEFDKKVIKHTIAKAELMGKYKKS